ncbi:unnamed protein product [Blepharisma stoltei]|uniref:GPI ethanolamine phosphate transferase 1 n=1 Tax=Blepharisma stoltei TaxID=1481888 RepID=A0AAU9I980_9CILI|nr:unnamed protein product [Blepharisma stoltei]
MKILWWLHLLQIIPSYYATKKCFDCSFGDRKIPCILSLVFLADYIPLLFSEALYDGFYWLVTFRQDCEYFSKEDLWLSASILTFIRQHVSVYSSYSFWIFGIVSILLSSNLINNLNYYSLYLPGLFNSLFLLFYYSVSGTLEYILYYFICFSIFIIWGFKIRYWNTELNPPFYFYNTSMLAGTLLAIKNALIPDIDLATCIVWILSAGIAITVPAIIFIYFCISFGSAFEIIRSSNQEFCNNNENDNNYLHNHKYVLWIFQSYFQIFFFAIAMILTATIFEEIFGSWNRMLIELFYLTAAATIGNALLYPNLNSNRYDDESFSVPINISGIYAQFWFLRILANFFNSLWT